MRLPFPYIADAPIPRIAVPPIVPHFSAISHQRQWLRSMPPVHASRAIATCALGVTVTSNGRRVLRCEKNDSDYSGLWRITERLTSSKGAQNIVRCFGNSPSESAAVRINVATRSILPDARERRRRCCENAALCSKRGLRESELTTLSLKSWSKS